MIKSPPTGSCALETLAAGLDRSPRRPFIAFSSVRCPFLVISQAGLVEGLAAPSPAELATLLALLRAYTEGCEGLRSHLLADFEGEMLGPPGELIKALKGS